ncbi:hypothetical protein RRG08_052264 [Elysia crispata]|uniref:Uncharacterized protein n=1 Tax=Elysia crispata TaxID=231223 RepID=A0AAE1A019_9GAST|nr:hypothetical protein RRG08_052264 [Elysia crispata]
MPSVNQGAPLCHSRSYIIACYLDNIKEVTAQKFPHAQEEEKIGEQNTIVQKTLRAASSCTASHAVGERE